MDEFLINISSFPTLIYSVGLVVISGYWILAFFGGIGLDIVGDLDLQNDGDTGTNEAGKATGALVTLGLTGVPISIVISLLIINAWFICYFISLFAFHLFQANTLIHFIFSCVAIVISFATSIMMTAQIVKPLRKIFRRFNQEPIERSIIGSSCRIRTSRADNDFGEAECSHEGASLIIKVRTLNQNKFSKGDLVVVIEYNKDNGTYIVVSKNHFDQQLN